MASAENLRLRELLLQALEKPAEVRGAFLNEACSGDQALQAEVQTLLSGLEKAGDVISADTVYRDAITAARARGRHEELPIEEGPGTKIGRYELLGFLGEGTFGKVYMAEQRHPISRRVALKIIKLGMDTKEVIARFEAERQALAMLDHPNVAKVLDAGATHFGRPYFVMELVKGVHITTYCDDNNLTMPERLELFIPVCSAVQHAHQKGIIHRDIKPSNVLVTVADDKPIPKIIDFGIAKATNARLTERTYFTEYGRLIGTPEYMSPEQAEMSGIDIDTRSDIYSLGVLLYQLLTGSTPFDPKQLRSLAYEQIQKMIRESDPPRPSTKLSSLGATLTTVAAHRKMEPRRLLSTMRGELDWIVMKCLEKDRKRRYATAEGLAEDIQRYMSSQPVEARPASKGYKLRKFVKRHTRGVSVAGAIVAAFLGLLVMLAWQKHVARRAKEKAESATDAALLNAKEIRDGKARAEGLLTRVYREAGDLLAQSGKFGDARLQYLMGLTAVHEVKVPDAPYKIALADIGHEPSPFTGAYGDDNHIAGAFKGCTDTITSLVLLRDGRTVVASSEDNTLQAWDALTGAPSPRKFSPSHSRDGASLIVLSADKDWLLSGSHCGEVWLWDLKTGKKTELQGNVERENFNVWALALSPDGNTALAGSEYHGIRAWDITDKAKPKLLDVHYDLPASMTEEEKQKEGVAYLAFARDGGTFFSGHKSGEVRSWNVRTGQHERLVDGVDERGNAKPAHRLQVNCLAVASDGQTLITSSFDCTIKRWNAITRKKVRDFDNRHSDWIWRIALSKDGRAVVSAGRDEKICVWGAEDGKLIRELTGQSAEAMGVAFSDDAQIAIASGKNSGNPTLRAWLVAPPASEAPKNIKSMAAGPHRVALCGTAGGDLVLWDGITGKRLSEKDGAHVGEVKSVMISADGRIGRSLGDDGKWKQWDLQTMKELEDRPCQVAPAGAITWRIGAGQIAEASAGTTQLGRLVHAGKVELVAASPDDSYLFAVGEDEKLALWDLAEPEELRTLEIDVENSRAKLNDLDKSVAAPAWRKLGEWHARRGSYKWAIDCFAEARKRGDNQPSLWLARAYWMSSVEDAPARTKAVAAFTDEMNNTTNADDKFYVGLCRAAAERGK